MRTVSIAGAFAGSLLVTAALTPPTWAEVPISFS
jgi:hypothetical protein